MSENLGDYLLEKREENKDEMETGLKTKYIGDWGELFALKYLKKLFKRNNINYNVEHHNYDKEDYDIKVSGKGKEYLIEVKTSTKENYPVFYEIHFNNNFDYLLLIWKPSDEEIYFAILTKKEAKRVATAMNGDMEDEDNWQIYAPEYFDETNKEFLKRLSEVLKLNIELEDLEDSEKLELLYASEEEIMKNPNAVKKDFSGVTYQQWFFDYLNNYSDDVEAKPKGDEYDIEFKGKHIEVKYSALYRGEFKFEHIKPNLFDFIFFIGFDVEKNKFYFAIKTSEEVVEIKRKTSGTDDFYSENGFELHAGKNSILNFVNDFTFEDFDNYIKSH